MFEIGESMKLSEISRRKEEGTLNEKILKVDQVFRNLPAVSVKSEWESWPETAVSCRIRLWNG